VTVDGVVTAARCCTQPLSTRASSAACTVDRSAVSAMMIGAALNGSTRVK